MKPFINIEDLEYEADGENLPGRSAGISNLIGAQKLQYNITICPPKKSVCPFHNHQLGEEMFMILEGVGSLRFGDETYEIKKGDVIACPPGGPEVAHQIINHGDVDLKYLSLSTTFGDDIVEYPDSGKVGVFSHVNGKRFMKMFKAEDNVKYNLGEDDPILYKD